MNCDNLCMGCMSELYGQKQCPNCGSYMDSKIVVVAGDIHILRNNVNQFFGCNIVHVHHLFYVDALKL